jgi:hypothetical protein
MSKRNSTQSEPRSKQDPTHTDRGPWANGWHPSWGDGNHPMKAGATTETEPLEFTPDQSTTHQTPDN